MSTEFTSYVQAIRDGGTVNRAHLVNVLEQVDIALREVAAHNKYLEDSLTAATTGELPERFDLNQLLLAQRAKAYQKWMYTTKDANDKLRPAGSNDEMVKK